MATWPTITDDDGSNTTGTVVNNANVWTPIQSYIGGAWSSRTFSAGNFTTDTGTWTVGSGDVVTDLYITIGKTVIYTVYLATTTVASSPNELRVTLPGGLSASNSVNVSGYAIINGTAEGIRADVAAAGTYVSMRRLTGGTWSASTDNTYVSFQIIFQIA